MYVFNVRAPSPLISQQRVELVIAACHGIIKGQRKSIKSALAGSPRVLMMAWDHVGASRTNVCVCVCAHVLICLACVCVCDYNRARGERYRTQQKKRKTNYHYWFSSDCFFFSLALLPCVSFLEYKQEGGGVGGRKRGQYNRWWWVDTWRHWESGVG